MNLLERRKQEIIWYLRSSVGTEEAEAMAGTGYRGLPCGGCGRQECAWCDEEPVEQVRVRGGKAAHDPRHVRILIQRLGVFEHRLAANIGPALQSLPPNERMVIALEYVGGLTQDQIARAVGTTRQTVGRWREHGLETMVHAVWPSTVTDLAVVSS